MTSAVTAQLNDRARRERRAGLDDLLERVRALASGDVSERVLRPSPFAAAEARATAMTHVPRHTRATLPTRP